MPFGRSHTCQPFLTPKTSLPEPAGTRPGAASAPGLPAIPACCRAAVARVRGILTAHPAIGHHASILRRAVGSPRSTAALIIVLGVFFCSTAAAQTAHFRGAQSTVPTSGLNFPNGVAVDGSGNVYIADTDNNRVLKETLSAGGYTQSTVADAASGGLTVPNGVAVDGSGNVYIADTDNNRVLKETLSAGSYTQSTVADAASSGLYVPYAVAVDGSGNVYIADSGNSRVLMETLSAGSYTQSIVADAASGGLYVPYAVAVDGSGNVYIADTGNGRVLMETLSASGYTQSIVADAASGGLDYPERVAVDGSGNVYIADTGNNRVLMETLSAASYTQSTVPTSGLEDPTGVAVDGSGNVYIADSGNSRVLMETLSNGNFGPVNLGSRSSNPISAIFTFDTAGTLNSWVEVAQGATALDFTDAGTSTCNPVAAYTAGETCAVGVAFTPARAGTRYGAVELLNLSGDVIATGYVQGTGVGPLVNFLPGTQSIVANYANNGLNNPYLPVVQLAIFQLGMHQTLIERLRS
jgi:DNA-binding beta-propeller fold protein YncE